MGHESGFNGIHFAGCNGLGGNWGVNFEDEHFARCNRLGKAGVPIAEMDIVLAFLLGIPEMFSLLNSVSLVVLASSEFRVQSLVELLGISGWCSSILKSL